MKKLLFIGIISCLMVSCGNKKTGSAAQTAETGTETAVSVYQLDDLLKVADQLVGQTVKVRGHVTHTCKHSGKRCFIVGEDENVTMRVEAKGEIAGFNRELVGSELEITGVVQEKRLTKEYIDQMEKETNEKKVQEEEACETELANISRMREWMKENDKDYYSIYYIDGQDYEVR